MTNQEAIKIISQMIKDEEGFLSDDTVEAHKMAIKALEQEPCGDAISRQAVLDMIEGFITDATSHGISPRLDPYYVMDGIKGLPPVKAEPKTGWIPVSERLPGDKNKDYLVCCADGYIATIMYAGFGRWLIDDAEIVAWMPLPKAYEPQESDNCN